MAGVNVDLVHIFIQLEGIHGRLSNVFKLILI